MKLFGAASRLILLTFRTAAPWSRIILSSFPSDTALEIPDHCDDLEYQTLVDNFDSISAAIYESRSADTLWPEFPKFTDTQCSLIPPECRDADKRLHFRYALCRYLGFLAPGYSGGTALDHLQPTGLRWTTHFESFETQQALRKKSLNFRIKGRVCAS